MSMTKDEEDTLIEDCRLKAIQDGAELVRLAIRAAYAKGQEDGRERAIKAVRAAQYPDTLHPAKVATAAIREGK